MRLQSFTAILVLVMSPRAVCQEVIYEIVDTWTGFGGMSYAMIGDLNHDGVRDFVIGLPGTTVDGQPSAGKATVYSGSDGAELFTVAEAKAYHLLGSQVNGMDDVNDDGVDDFLISVPGGPNALGRGRVRVYSGATGTSLFAGEGDAAGDYFGWACAAVGDVNGDGVADFAGSSESYVKVFSGKDAATLHRIDLPAPMLYPNMIGVGDINGDSFDDFLVATYSGDAGPRVYSGADGAILYTIDDLSLYGMHFNSWPRQLGDLNGDGFTELSITATDFRDTSTGVFSGLDGSLLREHNGGCAPLSDLTGDGVPDYAQGLPGEDVAEAALGTIRILSGRTGYVVDAMYIPEENESLGALLGNLGDLNHDGIPDLLVNDLAWFSPTGRGRVQVWAGEQPGLYHTPPHVAVGQPLTIALREGATSDIGVVVLTAVDDVPLFMPMTPFMTFDASGTILLQGVPGMSTANREFEFVGLFSTNGSLVVTAPDRFVVHSD